MPIAEETGNYNISLFNYYRKINCDLFFQIRNKPQISIIIKVVTRRMSETLKTGKEFTPELPNS